MPHDLQRARVKPLGKRIIQKVKGEFEQMRVARVFGQQAQQLRTPDGQPLSVAVESFEDKIV